MIRRSAATWQIDGESVRYDYGKTRLSPGLFTCSKHGQQRERRMDRWLYAPEPACAHVAQIGRECGFWTS